MEYKLLKNIRRRLLLFMALLCLSGLTAIPVAAQLRFGLQLLPPESGLYQWLAHVLNAYLQTEAQYPFLLYGYDWLAFGHCTIALFFIGAYKAPVQNRWVVHTGLWICVLVLPVAFIAGHFRGIPVWWRLADCSFGVLGFLLLWHIRTLINRLALYQNIQNNTPCVISNM